MSESPGHPHAMSVCIYVLQLTESYPTDTKNYIIILAQNQYEEHYFSGRDSKIQRLHLFSVSAGTPLQLCALLKGSVLFPGILLQD
jgi:hypothetical protein